MYYTMMALIENADSKTQELGLVHVSYSFDDGKSPIDDDKQERSKRRRDPLLARAVMQLAITFPMKRASSHVCLFDPKMEFIFKVIRPFFDRHDLSRLQFHSGTCTF